MDQLLLSIEKSVSTQNWYAALALSLTVPDVACALESPTGKTSGTRYAQWFDTHLGGKYGRDQHWTTEWLTGGDCWALRCAVLHEWRDDISSQSAQKVLTRVLLMPEGMHKCLIGQVVVNGNLVLNNALIISVRPFCGDIVEAARAWLSAKAGDAPFQQRLTQTIQIRSSFNFSGAWFGAVADFSK